MEQAASRPGLLGGLLVLSAQLSQGSRKRGRKQMEAVDRLLRRTPFTRTRRALQRIMK